MPRALQSSEAQRRARRGLHRAVLGVLRLHELIPGGVPSVHTGRGGAGRSASGGNKEEKVRPAACVRQNREPTKRTQKAVVRTGRSASKVAKN